MLPCTQFLINSHKWWHVTLWNQITKQNEPACRQRLPPLAHVHDFPGRLQYHCFPSKWDFNEKNRVHVCAIFGFTMYEWMWLCVGEFILEKRAQNTTFATWNVGTNITLQFLPDVQENIKIAKWKSFGIETWRISTCAWAVVKLISLVVTGERDSKCEQVHVPCKMTWVICARLMSLGLKPFRRFYQKVFMKAHVSSHVGNVIWIWGD